MQLTKSASSALSVILQRELELRCKTNPRYSLRAFARYLDVSPSLLSMVLAHKRAATPRLIEKTCKRLTLTADQRDALFVATPRKHRTDGTYQQFQSDQFLLISEWYHYAILELIPLAGSKPDPRWIARKLQISFGEAKASLERLQRLGLLSLDGKGGWKIVFRSNTNIDDPRIAQARRQLQKQILEKALAALENVPIEKRDQSSMTLAMDSRKLPEARRRILKFRRSLTRFLESGGTPDQVFNLSISLYPLTPSQEGELPC